MVTPLVLRRRYYRPTRRHIVLGTVVALSIAGIMLAVLWPLLASVPWSDPWERIKNRPDRAVTAGLELLTVLLLGGLHVWYLQRARRYERLLLDDTGIRYESPLPRRLAALNPSWSLAWKEIRSAEVVVPKVPNPNFGMVVLHSGSERRRIVGMWSAVDPAIAPQDAPHLEFMRRMGLTLESKPFRFPGFALESHRATLTAAAALLALLMYSLADWMLNTERYAVPLPLELYLFWGFIAAMACAVALGRTPIPRFEAWALSLALGGSFGLALYPGLLRINQLSDTEGLRPYQYRLADYVVLEPDDSALPRLTFTGYFEYWQQFRPGSRHEFMLRKGGLGFYQLDRAPLNARMRQFYQKQH